MRLSSTEFVQASVYRSVRGLRSAKRPLFCPRRVARVYAARTAATNPGRKQVTVIGDDGRIDWQDLSTREKAARTTQQSFNFLVVIAGAIGTVRLDIAQQLQLS